MGPVSRWAVKRPWQAVIAWIVVLFAIGFGVASHPGAFNDSFALPNTESTTAMNLLQEKFGDEANNSTASVLFTAGSGTINQPQLQQQIETLTKQIEAYPSVKSVQSPYTAATPLAALESGLVSPSGTIGKLNITFDTDDMDVPAADVKGIIADVQAMQDADTLTTIGITGAAVANNAVGGDSNNELIGIVLAIIIMLLLFGSVVAAGLPLITALLGLGAGIGMLYLSANFVSIASFAPQLAVMIGLGVGFDYSLFLINRYRQAVLEGSEPKDAALIAVATAGRAIVFAAITVVIALCGLFVLGLSFLNGLAIGAGVTVICVMITAVTLLPAIVSLLGKHALGWRLPWGRKPAGAEGGPRFQRYSHTLEKRHWLFGGIALLFMVILAIPVVHMRQGFPDAGSNPPGDTQRIAYDLTTDGFGAGSNGPFIVVVTMPNAQALPTAEALATAISNTPGVQLATPVTAGSKLISADGSTALITVIPTTGPQDEGTTQLLDRLRSQTIPQALQGTGVHAYVGGATAVAEDFSTVLTDKLPEFLLVVVGLGFLVLMVLFRSLLIPLTAALTALLSYFAALGVTVAVFQWGVGASMIGVYVPGPILPFVPVMMFAILFGLSMDYQVFLVSRMQEEWESHKDNRRAVRVGLGGSGRVIVAAATIMFSVFLSFVFQANPTIKLFGLSLAVAVALDAFVIRLMFVPALMTVLGKANWYVPKWLDKILPKISAEGAAPAAPAATEPGPGSDESEREPEGAK